MGRSAPLLTRSRRSLPGLKCGTYLPASATASPVFGLRPWRGGRKCSEKLPKPRISMRSPCDRASLMISRICFSASSTSLAGRCFCLAVMTSISSDLVMRVLCRTPSRASVSLPGTVSAAIADLFLEQVAEARARGRCLLGAIALYRLGFLVHLFRLDGQRNGARLAIHTGELGVDLLAHLQHRACIFDAITGQIRAAQLAFNTVAQV